MQIKAQHEETGQEITLDRDWSQNADRFTRQLLGQSGYIVTEVVLSVEEKAAEAEAEQKRAERAEIMQGLKTGDRIVYKAGLVEIKGRVSRIWAGAFEIKVRKGWHITLKPSENWQVI